jgi:hypothetical protein
MEKHHVDYEKVVFFLNKAIDNEKLAHNELKHLIENYPNSVSVLRLFGSLLRDIYRNDDDAIDYLTYASEIEDEWTSIELIQNDNVEGLSVISGKEYIKDKNENLKKKV